MWTHFLYYQSHIRWRSLNNRVYFFIQFCRLDRKCFPDCHCVKTTYSKFFKSIFSGIWTKYGNELRKSPHSVRIWKIGTRKTPNTFTFYAVRILSPFHGNGQFLYFWKQQKTRGFLHLQGYRNDTLTWNWLKTRLQDKFSLSRFMVMKQFQMNTWFRHESRGFSLFPLILAHRNWQTGIFSLPKQDEFGHLFGLLKFFVWSEKGN